MDTLKRQTMQHEQRVEPEVSDSWVLEELEPDQLVGAKAHRFGLRELSPGVRLLMWALRFYAVLMLVAVIYQVVMTVRGG
ncbi:MAG: hypothetical protein NVS4B8_28900 [Herpetosiphon sp.]